ncbi:MAG: tRNA threonylcarbamoyladenosine dehydratase [Acholeplasmataceae bacterium]|nr:tRNA threonylcarbamoyladenosine dehydratase [Acholeplasmataceae bacterium]
MNNLERLIYLFGPEKIEKLKAAKVAVVGLGGVGGIAALALARSGVGTLVLQDFDLVQESNINRQILANYQTLGRKKVEVCHEEVLKVNPECRIIALDERYNEESSLFQNDFSYLIDAIDAVEDKFLLMKTCLEREINFISAMGAAKKLDPTKMAVMEIKKTTYDPLAKIIRRKLREENMTNPVMVVSSTEEVQKIPQLGSYMGVTATAGLLLADYIIKKIIGG